MKMFFGDVTDCIFQNCLQQYFLPHWSSSTCHPASKSGVCVPSHSLKPRQALATVVLSRMQHRMSPCDSLDWVRKSHTASASRFCSSHLRCPGLPSLRLPCHKIAQTSICRETTWKGLLTNDRKREVLSQS